MARTPMLTPDRVPEHLRAAFDAETASSGGVVTTGPGSVMINSPEMRRRANHLVNYLRDESTLPKKIQELAMLITARAMDCQFIWNAHAARGRREGLSDALVNALRDRQPLPPLPADEATVVHYGTEFFNTHKVQPRDVSSGAGPIRCTGPDRTDYSDGLLCAAGLQRQRVRDRPPGRADRAGLADLSAAWAISAGGALSSLTPVLSLH